VAGALLPWLVLTGAPAAVLVVRAEGSQPAEVTLLELPERFATIRAVRPPTSVPLTTPPARPPVWRPAKLMSQGTACFGAAVPRRVTPPPHGSRWTDPLDDPRVTVTVDAGFPSYTRALQVLRSGGWPTSASPREFLVAAAPSGRAGEDVVTDGRVRVGARLVPTPWTSDSHLLWLDVAAEPAPAPRDPVDLTLLVDTASVGTAEGRLLQETLHQLVDGLEPDDSVALWTLDELDGPPVLAPTPALEQRALHHAIDRLPFGRPGPFAVGDRPMQVGAAASGRSEHVLLVMDGASGFHVPEGESLESWLTLARQGVSLSVLTVGAAVDDDLHRGLDALAAESSGTYHHVVDGEDARRVVHHELLPFLHPAAHEVELQTAFYERRVARYRVLGDAHGALDDSLQRGDHRAHSLKNGAVSAVLVEVELPSDGPWGAPPSLGRLHLRSSPVGSDGVPTVTSADLGWPMVPLAELPPADRVALAAAGLAEVLGGRVPADVLPRLARLARGAANPESARHAELLEAFDLAMAHDHSPETATGR